MRTQFIRMISDEKKKERKKRQPEDDPFVD